MFSALCSKAFVDEETHEVALVLAEEITFLMPENVNPALGDRIPCDLTIVSTWTREPHETGRLDWACRSHIEGPTSAGRRLESPEFAAMIQEDRIRFRARVRIPILPWLGEGRYTFVMEARLPGRVDWEHAASLPLIVRTERVSSVPAVQPPPASQ
ncbi:MAG: hypothetical protein HY908_05000 [Myxococcales bacterium]|nr:hypothetical protein [Myxococcales bacterium]